MAFTLLFGFATIPSGGAGGLAGKDSLRGMLARLQPKEEVLLLGWGVPMPIPVKSRRYNDLFWRELKGDDSKRQESDILKELGF